ncbi:hypothetical protein I2494_20220 [Budviciaceae bacterium BWR-B9]|uniref:GpE family phage tail protein n=1 Tax=Limnobaculum allomyrinae TaxID=2791986 RepID=A0ABS1IWD7_9GAMM|nr:hypothetical protein [Limnobaculum allomyrinae]
MTYFFSWGPADAEALTYSRLMWWRKQAERINKVKAGK